MSDQIAVADGLQDRRSTTRRYIYVTLRLGMIKNDLEDAQIGAARVQRRAASDRITDAEAKSLRHLKIYYAERIKLLKIEQKELLNERRRNSKSSVREPQS